MGKLLDRQKLRAQRIKDGVCPMCAGKEPLIPGKCYGRKCQIDSEHRRAHSKPIPPPDAPVGSLWSCGLDGLALAIQQAEQDLQAVSA